MFKYIINHAPTGLTAVNNKSKLIYGNNMFKKIFFKPENSKQTIIDSFLLLKNVFSVINDTSIYNRVGTGRRDDDTQKISEFFFDNENHCLGNQSNQPINEIGSNISNFTSLAAKKKTKGILISDFKDISLKLIQSLIPEYVSNDEIKISSDMSPDDKNAIICRTVTLKDLIQRIFSSMENLMIDFKKKPKYQNIVVSLVFENAFTFFTYKENEIGEKKLLELKLIPALMKNKPIVFVHVIDKTDKDVIKGLKRTEEERGNMINAVSHEFRTPLDAIIAMLEILENCIDERLNKKYLQPVLSTSRTLLYLVNDILDSSQIKEGKFKLNIEGFKVPELISSCKSLIEIKAGNQGIKILVEIDQSLKFKTIYSDPKRIKQIITNLLGNAVKFTHFGYIKIIANYDDEENNLEICVEDTGLGIRNEDKVNLFQNFGKVRNSETDMLNSNGVGLGLMISNKLAFLLSPNESSGLLFESLYGKGSKFYFKVSNHLQSTSNTQNENFNEDSSFNLSMREDTKNYFMMKKGFSSFRNSRDNGSEKKSMDKKSLMSKQSLGNLNCNCANFLIIDDEEINLMVLINHIESLGLFYDKGFTGEQAIEMVIQRSKSKCCKRYAIIFLDNQLPGISGIEAAREINKLIDAGVLPPQIIVACTGTMNSEKEKKRFLNAGMSDFATKPMTIFNFKAMIKKWAAHLLNN